MEDILTRLQNLGISPAESKVYLTLIKLGNARAGQIISLVELSSSNVHEALEKLTKKGLISSIIKNGVKEYSPSDPKNLELLLQKEKQEIIGKEASLKTLLSEIASIQTLPKADQNAEVYSGFNGIRSAFRKLLSEKSENSDYAFFYSYNAKEAEKVHKFFSKMDMEDYYDKINTRGIFSLEYRKLFNKRKNKIEARFTEQPIPSSVNMFGDRTLLVSWGERPVGYLIESFEISQMFRELFESIWKLAEK